MLENPSSMAAAVRHREPCVASGPEPASHRSSVPALPADRGPGTPVSSVILQSVLSTRPIITSWMLLTSVLMICCIAASGNVQAEDALRPKSSDTSNSRPSPTLIGRGINDIKPRTTELLTVTPVAAQSDARIVARAADGDIANRYQFDAELLNPQLSADGFSLKYRWQFGDGTGLVGINLSTVRHTFPPGKFVALVSIEDSTGTLGIASVEIGEPSMPELALQAAVAEPAVAEKKQKNTLLLPEAAKVLPSTLEQTVADSTSLKDETVAEAEAKPAVPVNLSPATDELLNAGATIPFIWGAAARAARYDFRILDAGAQEVVRVGEFSSSAICSGNRCRLNQDLALDTRQQYKWQVRAGNAAGWSSWSATEVSVVPVGVKAPRIPLGLFPTAGDLLARGETTRFLWTHREGVEGYQFQLIDTSTKAALHSVRVNAGKACNATQCAFPRKISLEVSDNYAWQIRATNAAGESGWYRTAIKVVNGASGEPPVARFTPKLSDVDPLVVQFNASGSSDDQSVVRYAWSFGEQGNEDIVVSDGPVIEHRYAEGGSFIAVLTVTDEAGLTASTFEQVDVGSGTAPQAHFAISSFTGGVLRAPVLLTFDPASSSGDRPLTSFTWDFGDGTQPLINSESAVVSHVFSSSGEFIVRLRIANELNLSDVFEETVTVLDSVQGMSTRDAGRFLAQATFGANRQSIDRVRELGFEGWLSEQFGLKNPSHLDYVRQQALQSDRSVWHEIWWHDVVHGSDQLRQRVAYVLSQVFSLPDSLLSAVDAQHGVAAWYDLLRDHAFGNYRELLEAMTLSPVMGLWRGSLQNSASLVAVSGSLDGASPAGFQVDEGFARSLLRDFTLGDVMLEADGNPTWVRAWNDSDVSSFARALTGWNLNGATEWSLEQADELDWVSRMVANDDHHDTGAKTLLDGELLPPGLSAEQDLRLALDNLFAASNLGPIVATKLIKGLVTTNPRPDYIQRVAAVFADNGQGVRGDLRAVIRSILMDENARELPGADSPGASGYGKLRTPLFRLAHLWRVFDVQPGTLSVNGELQSRDARIQSLSQQAPLLDLFSANSLITSMSEITEQIQRYSSITGDADDLQYAHLDFSAEFLLADRPAVLLKHLDNLLLAGNMSDDLYGHLLDHLNRLPNTAAGHSSRVGDAVSLILASPDYLVQM